MKKIILPIYILLESFFVIEGYNMGKSALAISMLLASSAFIAIVIKIHNNPQKAHKYSHVFMAIAGIYLFDFAVLYNYVCESIEANTNGIITLLLIAASIASLIASYCFYQKNQEQEE